jgi:hypothetical protein
MTGASLAGRMPAMILAVSLGERDESSMSTLAPTIK